ncbi:MAG: App1 family protein [Rubrobacteraceae bacterium]
MDRLISMGRVVEGLWDQLRAGVKHRMEWMGPVEILPYRGHGTSRTLFLKGRVLVGKGITRSNENDTVITNVRNMIRRFASDEIPFARVRARFEGRELETRADKEGFFDLRFDLDAAPETSPEVSPGGASNVASETSTGWHPVEIELTWPYRKGDETRATGYVLVPSGPRFGVISDLDDTVVRTSVRSLLKMLKLVLLSNAHARLPFEGVAAFYQALQQSGGREFNPIFYVSNGPWNLYDLMEDFLDVHGLPAGPLFLRDWSATTVRRSNEHKLGIIRTLLETYPQLQFILIGDSGEKDPEIYHRIVLEHPGRISKIYIRDVSNRERANDIHFIAREVASSGVEMLLVPDTAAAAEHAAREGLIPPSTLPQVRQADAP